MYTAPDLSTQQLSELLGVTPRMVNIYRKEAERLSGQKLGARRGQTVFFSPTEQESIRSVQLRGVSSKQPQPQPDFSSYNNQAEDGIIGGMDSIVADGDQNAIALGQALGQRWNQLLWASAIQSMQGGMVQMQEHFGELYTSVSLELSQPQLPGRSLPAPALPEDIEEIEEKAGIS